VELISISWPRSKSPTTSLAKRRASQHC
jgi:hypothetical protein